MVITFVRCGDREVILKTKVDDYAGKMPPRVGERVLFMSDTHEYTVTDVSHRIGREMMGFMSHSVVIAVK